MTYSTAGNTILAKIRASTLPTKERHNNFCEKQDVIAAALLIGNEVAVHIGPTIPVELPGVTNLFYQIEVEVGNEQFFFFVAGSRQIFATRVAEVA